MIGGVLVLLGAVWIGQGLGMLPGQLMSGHPQWAAAGLVLAGLGVVLLWRTTRPAAR